MDNRLLLHPPAKINLTLSLMGKRPDGYHAIDTIMIRTSLVDELEIRLVGSPGIQLSCDDPSLPVDFTNLAMMAAELFFNQSGLPARAELVLKKRIPSGGGLGGGSADAAYVLSGLNDLHGKPLSHERLSELAGTLGSDVPFFLGHAVARCTGRGEIIEPLDPAPFPKRAVLVNPGFGVPTGWAYQTYAALPSEKKQGEVSHSFSWGEMRNDLEPAVFSKYLLLPEIKRWLAAQPGVVAAQMSGSGATMFGLLEASADFPKLKLEFHKEFGDTSFFAEVRLG